MNLKLYLIAASLCFSVSNNLTASALIKSFNFSRINEINELFERKANKEAVDVSGRTSLHAAATNGWGKVAKELLGRGAKIEAVDMYGRTAWIIAARFCRKDVTEELLKYKVNVNAETSSGKNAFNLAPKHCKKYVMG